MTDDDFVRFVQEALAQRGHYTGKVDGIPGRGTKAALLKALGPTAAPEEPPATSAPLEWDARSARSLEGVHPDLVRVMALARDTSPVPFVVIEGLRTVQRQKELVARGASKTMRSRHLTGHAVDIVPLNPDGKIAFDWPLYNRLLPAVREAAKTLGVACEFGADWPRFRDGPHVQLDWAAYP